MDPPGFQQGARVRRRQRWAADGQLVAAANKKAEEAKNEKVEAEEVETIGKKGAEFKPLETNQGADKTDLKCWQNQRLLVLLAKMMLGLYVLNGSI